MTPKEKAIEIFRKFVIKHNGWSENEYTLNYSIDHIKEHTFNNQWFIPKECAIYCVNEIINVCKINNVESYNIYWWNKVKQEIYDF